MQPESFARASLADHWPRHISSFSDDSSYKPLSGAKISALLWPSLLFRPFRSIRTVLPHGLLKAITVSFLLHSRLRERARRIKCTRCFPVGTELGLSYGRGIKGSRRGGWWKWQTGTHVIVISLDFLAIISFRRLLVTLDDSPEWSRA
jgi:hypothetical protein